MGILSSSKKVYVASSVFKMSDPVGSGNPSFMQQALVSTALTGDLSQSLGQAVVDAHLKGPRSSQRAFFRWAKRNFDFGMPRAAINYTESIDHTVVAQVINDEVFASDTNTTVNVLTAYVDPVDEIHYAEQYILANNPEHYELEWVADYDETTDTIWIQNPEGTVPQTDSFGVTDFNSSDRVLVAYYTTSEDPDTQIYIYTIGGTITALNNFDVSLTNGEEAREFYPFIPIRINNKSVFEEGSPAADEEEIITKAYKKGVGGEFSELVSEIDNNPDVGDIDYAYVAFGVCLNDESRFGKRYIFEFLRTLAEFQETTSSDFSNFISDNNAEGYHSVHTESGGEEVNTAAVNSAIITGFLDGSGADHAKRLLAPKENYIHLTLPDDTLGVVDMRISWIDVSEQTVRGQAAPGITVNDVTVGFGAALTQNIEIPILGNDRVFKRKTRELVVRKQINRSEYVEIIASGLLHKNQIYKGKSVDTYVDEAFEDDEDSPFFLPLHEPTLKRLGLINSTEVTRDSLLMVLNSYKVVKKKFYEKGFFKVFIVVAVITAIVVLAVVTGGASLGPSAPILGGVLGSSVAIGTALGFSGLLALAVGTAINVLAAMIITQLVTVVASEVLGEKIGKIVAIVVAVAMTFAGGNFDFSNIGSNLANMASIDKLLILTSAAADIAGVYQQAEIDKITENLADITEQHNDEIKRLKEAYEALGFGGGIIDPLMLTDLSANLTGKVFSPNSFESSADFLTRTLMTGSDLIDLSQSMIDDFTDVMLTLP